ncbi:PEP-utilizing enzyme [Streptomyces sp. NPDC093105]|uniref:PEP-utilizing enzyme n=1 Tax=Streptomyces sp. NPDC093105 TaxID=3366029 RepID=UPI00382D2992
MPRTTAAGCCRRIRRRSAARSTRRPTDIGGTPLFTRISAIVTDVGADLSHASIVARGLGIPAVVGCGNATTRIRTGAHPRRRPTPGGAFGRAGSARRPGGVTPRGLPWCGGCRSPGGASGSRRCRRGSVRRG